MNQPRQTPIVRIDNWQDLEFFGLLSADAASECDRDERPARPAEHRSGPVRRDRSTERLAESADRWI